MRWSFVRHWGDARLIMIDSRAGPGARRAAAPDGRRRRVRLDRGGDAARGGRGRQHLILGTSLPWLLPHAIRHLERWNETLNVRHEGAWRGRLAEKLRQAADLEHWAAFGDSFERLGRGADVGGPRRARAGARDGAGALRRRPPRLRRRARAPRRPDRPGAPADGLAAAQPGAAPDPGRLPDRLEPVGEAVHRRAWRGWRGRSRASWSGRSRPARSSATRSASWCSTGREARFQLSVTELGQDGPAAGARHAPRRSLTGWRA